MSSSFSVLEGKGQGAPAQDSVAGGEGQWGLGISYPREYLAWNNIDSQSPSQ